MSSIKRAVKQRTPKMILPVLNRAYKQWLGLSTARYDYIRFNRSRFKNLSGSTLTQLESKLVFHAHSIEKGLSHVELRYNFGATALSALAKTIQEYNRQGFDKGRLPYVNALSTLKSYQDCHAQAGVTSEIFPFHFESGIMEEIQSCDSTIGGVKEHPHPDGTDSEFANVFKRRSSVREFAHKQVPIERVLPAIQLAMKSPSVCNRQSSRVKIVTDSFLIKQLMALQGGMSGYKLPPMLLIITSDMASFLEPTERNQPFIDGGLYSMSLLLALENERLAACPLNAMMTGEKEESIRSLLQIPISERLIMFIAVGEFSESTKIPKSFRHTADHIVSIY